MSRLDLFLEGGKPFKVMNKCLVNGASGYNSNQKSAETDAGGYCV